MRRNLSKVSILVGLGSVGKKHLQELLRRYLTVLVVDIEVEEQRAYITSKSLAGRVFVYSSFDELRKKLEALESPTVEIAVLADWATSRLLTLKSILEFRPRHLLLEKIVADSLSAVEEMEYLVDEVHRIPCVVNFHLRQSDLYRKIVQVSEDGFLGTPTSIVEQGGARCMATTGIHWLDFASLILKEEPCQVSAKVSFPLSNPRSENIRIADGWSHWMYPSGAQFSIIYDARSSNQSRLCINWRNAVAIYTMGALTLEICEDDLEKEQPITKMRNNYKCETIRSLVNADLSKKDNTFSRIYDELFIIKPKLKSYSSSTKNLLKAFINSEADIDFNQIDSSGYWKNYRWKVT